MIQLVLLIAAIRSAVMYPRVAARTAANYPGVDPLAFDEWHKADMKYVRALIILGIGPVLLMMTGLGILFIPGAMVHDKATLIGNIGLKLYSLSFVAVVISFVYTLIIETRARRLKKAAGIQ